jgi:hypothetical protein
MKRILQFVVIALAALLATQPILADAACVPGMNPACDRDACCGMTDEAVSSAFLSHSAWSDFSSCNPGDCDRPTPHAVASLPDSVKDPVKTNPVAQATIATREDAASSQKFAPSVASSSANAPPRYLLFRVIRV